MVKVTVVVPIYNVEKHLQRSIESLLKQTLKEIEIILVNDGSTDNSISICKYYEKKDSRIRVIDKLNGGVSSARNIGIDLALGEFVGFVDPDDWVEPDMYEKMYKKIKISSSDLCICNYVKENNEKVIPVILPIKKETLVKCDVQKEIIPNMIGPSNLDSNSQTIMGSACRLLINREFINSDYYRFPEDIPLMEDLIFCIKVFLNSEKVVIERGIYYHYMTNDNSAIRKYRNNMLEMQKNVFNVIINILMDYKLYELYINRLNIRYVEMFLTAIANEVNNDNRNKYLQKIKTIKKMSADEKLKKIISEINTSSYSMKKKLILFAVQRDWAIYLYMHYKLMFKIINK
ncbi:putative glycosyltransferase EpsJ [Jeotgalibaca dankookensis]|uniref:Putative glycosyltransferase EpsJ n=1 Tax=Jeotgalibaca dankookensis TaxID=708126 RepID=A0A1S6IM56_9LACT|nr:glycosyltransferase [Jeotgalibaca dankookensis]AQS52644.1 putative glycosyltransferase EpsJ [Jeotgalibaca dankookensis]